MEVAIAALWLVDGFGRGVAVPPAALAQARGELPPRLSNPARLTAGWRAADGAVGRVAEPHGWLLHGHLDRSLAVFSAEGAPLGSLLLTLDAPVVAGGRQGLLWQPAPGDPDAATYWSDLRAGREPGLRAGAIPDPVLGAWIADLLALSRDDAAGLMDGLVAAKTETAPPAEVQGGMDALASAPMALLTAEVAFAFAGLDPPSGAPIPAAFAPGVQGGVFGHAGLRPGALGGCDDGLILARAAGSRGFVAPDGFVAARAATAIGADPVPVPLGGGTARAEGPGAVLEMLVDPTRPVRLRCGLLPDTALAPPAGLGARLRRLRHLSFAAGPVLTDGDAPRIPAPSDAFGAWSWRTRPDIRSWSAAAAPVPPDEARAAFDRPMRLADGWLTLQAPPISGFHCVEGPEAARGARITLVWDVRAAATVSLRALPEGGAARDLLEGDVGDLPQRHRVRLDRDTTFVLTARDADGAPLQERSLPIRAKEASPQ
jgi:hypothetical protein